MTRRDIGQAAIDRATECVLDEDYVSAVRILADAVRALSGNEPAPPHDDAELLALRDGPACECCGLLGCDGYACDQSRGRDEADAAYARAHSVWRLG